jgi:hypothetical protein
MVNVLTPNTISEFKVENFLLTKLIENGNDLYRDIFNNNDIDKSNFKESINYSNYIKTPNFSINNNYNKVDIRTNDIFEIENDNENNNDE